MDQHLTSVVLKNGTIIDGTGARGFSGDLLIQDGEIQAVSDRAIEADCPVVDCAGKVIAPGFIDIHSHNDWFLPNADRPDLTTPFTEQGITTFVGGNCGFGAAGIKPDSRFTHLIEDSLFKAGTPHLRWATMAEYIRLLEKQGITHNLAMLAGHGSVRASIRGMDPSPMKPGEVREMNAILDQAMDEGAKGVSFGLQYAPGIFARDDEIRKVVNLVKKREKIVAVHKKALSSISAAYGLVPFGRPHNLIALEEMIRMARETGVRLQISHLIFVGTRSWKTFDRAMSLIDTAIDQGVDVMFDTYSHHCGASIITVLMPDWFLAGAPASFTDRAKIFRARLLAAVSFRLLGFGFEDIQIASANHDELNRFNGMFLSDIARERGLDPFGNYMDFLRKSNGNARVLMHRYTSPDILEALMKHRAALFMTDAWAEPDGLQNPAAYGCFPRFLALARDKRLLTPEQVIHKMTGANARRFDIRDRGTLEKGKAADITVFDWERVRDNTTLQATDVRPSGIESVFINGVRVVEKGRADPSLRPGRVLI